MVREERGRSQRFFPRGVESELDSERQQVNLGLGSGGKQRESWKLNKRYWSAYVHREMM